MKNDSDNNTLKRSIVVLAGGKSRQMGADKATIRFRTGETWIEKIVESAKEVSDDVLVITGAHCNYQDLVSGETVRVFPDDAPQIGPLGGIVTAISKTIYPTIVFLSCHMPNISGKLLSDVPFPVDPLHAYFCKKTQFPFAIRISDAVRRIISEQIWLRQLA